MIGLETARIARGRAARESVHAPTEDGTVRAAGSVPSRTRAEERETYAVLAALKPDGASDAVLRTAQWLAEREHRALHVVSVVETAPLVAPPSMSASHLPVHHEERRRAIKQSIRAAYDRIGHSAPRFRIDVVDGSAPATIADIAREHEVRIVVVGRGTHGSLGRLVRGEHVLEIIRRTMSPVLVVPASPALPVERAMVAFDFSMASIRAAATALELLGPGGCLTLVHVTNPGRGDGHRSQWWLHSAERRMRETLRDFARALPSRAGVAVETAQVHGPPAEVLTAYARSQAIQLLACGWHGQGLLARMFAEGGTAELLHRAECAMLVAQAPRGRASTHPSSLIEEVES